MPQKKIKPGEETITVTVKLSKGLLDRIDSLAAKEDRSRSYLIRKLLENSVMKRQAEDSDAKAG